MKNKISALILSVSCLTAVAESDSIPGMFSRPLEWKIGVEITPSYVPATNGFLRGDNTANKRINTGLGGALRADFSFNPETREGMLYRGLYQGIGLGVNGYLPGDLLGCPFSAYVYQGAPIVNFSKRFWLGYEWQFGATFGWKHYNEESAPDNVAIGSPVTAHMGIGLKLNYQLTDRWRMSFGLGANHYSNGNTSWPNRGVNTLGVSLGIAYVLNPQADSSELDQSIIEDGNRHQWMYDIAAYGAWRKRAVMVGYPEQSILCPGRFGILGLQFSPLYKLNRWVAVGPAVDFQWDEGGGIEPYWVEGSYDDNVKFERPPFGKQISVGVSGHAELVMPIFSINVGLGYDFINPKGDKAFFQSLTLKTFVTKNIFINTGYRLGNFKYPQNLMLGIGVRL